MQVLLEVSSGLDAGQHRACDRSVPFTEIDHSVNYIDNNSYDIVNDITND